MMKKQSTAKFYLFNLLLVFIVFSLGATWGRTISWTWINAAGTYVNSLTATEAELNQLDGVTVGGNSSGDVVTTDDTQTLSGKSFTQTGTITITDNGSVGNREPLKLLTSSLAGGGFARLKLGRADSNYNAADFAFYYNSDGSAANRLGLGVIGAENALRIDGLGNVGIGKTSAGAELDVDGEVEATSLDINGPADISGDTVLHGTISDGGSVLLPTFAEINTTLDGCIATAAEINTVADGITANAAEVNKAADGIGATIPRQIIVDIGDWNMDAGNKSLAHGQTLSKIIGVRVMIRDDADTLKFPISTSDPDSDEGLDAFIYQVNSTNIVLNRTNSGAFDSTDYDATSYNRGWIIFDYVD